MWTISIILLHRSVSARQLIDHFLGAHVTFMTDQFKHLQLVATSVLTKTQRAAVAKDLGVYWVSTGRDCVRDKRTVIEWAQDWIANTVAIVASCQTHHTMSERSQISVSGVKQIIETAIIEDDNLLLGYNFWDIISNGTKIKRNLQKNANEIMVVNDVTYNLAIRLTFRRLLRCSLT